MLKNRQLEVNMRLIVASFFLAFLIQVEIDLSVAKNLDNVDFGNVDDEIVSKFYLFLELLRKFHIVPFYNFSSINRNRQKNRSIRMLSVSRNPLVIRLYLTW